jgi:hypothetical protein
MLPYILHFMKISQNQIKNGDINCNISNSNPRSNEGSTNDSTITLITSKKPSIIKKNFNLDKLDIDEDIDYLEYFVYNSYWTLRKSSSKLLDQISFLYSFTTFSIIKPFLEVDLQSSDWIKK